MILDREWSTLISIYTSVHTYAEKLVVSENKHSITQSNTDLNHKLEFQIIKISLTEDRIDTLLDENPLYACWFVIIILHWLNIVQFCFLLFEFVQLFQ